MDGADEIDDGSGAGGYYSISGDKPNLDPNKAHHSSMGTGPPGPGSRTKEQQENLYPGMVALP